MDSVLPASRAAHGWRVDWRSVPDSVIRAALYTGFFALAIGGVVTEKVLHVGYAPDIQWGYALGGSAIGVIWGF
jgi:hypothetical protein